MLAARPDDDPLGLRYLLGDKLGEGGMGIVHACRDRRIGRDVALKMVRTEHAARADLVSRFLREACVQGQLEHPAIVPVYDLGTRPRRERLLHDEAPARRDLRADRRRAPRWATRTPRGSSRGASS